jgi:hypothetical protein
MALERRCLIVLLAMPAAQELLVWNGVGGWGHPISHLELGRGREETGQVLALLEEGRSVGNVFGCWCRLGISNGGEDAGELVVTCRKKDQRTGSALHGFYENGFAIEVVQDERVCIAESRGREKTAGLVGVDLTTGFFAIDV